MKFYQDITLLPDPETDLYFLWQKVYQQIHLALVEVKDEQDQVATGLSWPNYRYSKASKHLGNKVRVFAETEAQLSSLNLDKWLSRFSDYVHITQMRPIPEKIEGHVCFSRVNAKSSKENIARRKAKRENIAYETALAAIANVDIKRPDLPFIALASLSSDQRFPLFIAQGKIQSEPQLGSFNTYGLSNQATVPWF